MLQLMDLTMMILSAVMAMTMFLMRTEIMLEAKLFAMMSHAASNAASTASAICQYSRKFSLSAAG
jgi:hypothetical protein